MNREQKAAAIDELAAQMQEVDALFAVDYRGISVPQAAELRGKLRDADATFRVVKNSLTERAADKAGAETLKELLEGPTALTFVRGDVAMAAKAIADFARATQLLPFKGGLMNGEPLDAEQIRAISRLPARDVLYGQLVGVVASPVTGLVRTLNALLGGLAVALGQVREKKESGEIPAGEPPAAAEAEAAAAEAPAAAAVEAEAAEEAPAAEVAEAVEAEVAEEAPAAEAPAADAPEEPAEAPEEPAEAAEEPAEAAEEPAEAAEEPAEAAEEPAEAAAAEAPADEPAAEAPPEPAHAPAAEADPAEPEKHPAQDENQA